MFGGVPVDARKVCSKCHLSKSRSEFTRHTKPADGLNWWCRPCANAAVRAARLRNIDYYREYDRVRAMGPEREASLAKSRARHVAKHRERLVATNAANNAVRDGKLSPPAGCQRCGARKRLEKHHDDYSKPLDVAWLCKPCHFIADASRRTREMGA